MTRDHEQSTEPDYLEPLGSASERAPVGRAPLGDAESKRSWLAIRLANYNNRRAAGEHPAPVIAVKEPNWLCPECEDLGYWVKYGRGQIDDTPCEECPSCEVCSDPLHESHGHHLLDFAVGIRWCTGLNTDGSLDLQCFESALDGCVTHAARVGLLTAVYGDFYTRCLESDIGKTPNVQEIDERLREEMAKYLFEAQLG